MKHFRLPILFITLFSLSIMNAKSQNTIKNYDAAWKKVEDFVKKNLPKSALTEVKNIYALAKKENQDAQVIKSLLYITGLQTETRENNESFSITEIEKEIVTAKEPAKSILNSLLAEMYWSYYQQVRWNLYQRTATTDFKKEDIATWSADDFHKKITALYLLSVNNDKILQQTKLETFDALIVKGNVRYLRPTLFDILINRALNYFENDERDISKPAYAFEIDQASAFDPAADFVKRKFPTKDSTSVQHKALLIYQQWIAFHLNDTKPDALIDADLQRIAFVKEKSVHPDKDQLYFNAINHIAQQYQATPAATQAWFLLASYYEQQAATYKPYGDTTHHYDRIKAKEICEKILKQVDVNKTASTTPGLEGAINCYNLLNQINSQSLQFSIEKVNLPEQPFRSLVEYKNINNLYLHLVKADEALKKNLEDQYGDKYWTAILAAKPIRSWQQSLTLPADLQEHSAEIKIDALPSGEYMLIAATDKDLANKKTIIGARLFYVSSISFTNNGQDYFILNRDNGQPLASAAVQVWEQKYDYKQSKYLKEKSKLYKTDVNGFFRMEKPKEVNNYNYNFVLDITHKNDRLFMNDLMNNYYYRNNEPAPSKAVNSIFLFTDRGIYRPGQTLYFKGITLARLHKNSEVVSNYSTTVYLRDANYQDIDSIKLKTNEFGSFSGKFQLPQSGLNGSFSLYTKKDNGNANFQVEEYKRPKFYVDYEPLKGTYKVNDNIKITGFAKAYAGNNIDGATVKYRVVRQPRFIYYWMFKRGWQPPASPLEIAHGEVLTDKDGKFLVDFTAIPDLKIDRKLEPVFDYTVYADITDINGETRSGEQRISVSYKSLLLSASIPASMPADSLKKLFIRTQNMNGEFEPATVKVSITKLQEEKRLIRDRYWERPDQFVMSKEAYIKSFPYDEYDNETDNKSWAKGDMVFEKTDSVKDNGQWAINNTSFVPGFYIIEITTKDKNGEEVKEVQYTQLYDDKSKQLNTTQYLWTEAAKPIEPGEKTTVKLGTSADNLFIVQQVDKRSDADNAANNSYSFIKLNNEKKTIDFSATEVDRGGYGAGWVFIKHNRVYQYNQTISVPWTNKDLSIEYATYRNKTLPGSEEKWKLKITGYKKEKVAAEMLASMYDASLDQFYPFNWNAPYIWPYYYNSSNWSSNQNFILVNANLKDRVYPESKYYNKLYDQLTSFESNDVVVIGYGGKKKSAGSADQMNMRMAAPSVAKSEGLMNSQIEEKSADGLKISTDSISDKDEESDKFATEQKKQQGSEVQIRKNFNETAFFIPDLKTDSSGAIEFSFTLPEALTKWKFQALTHTKDAAFGYSSTEIVTQKQLMVQPNAPRFLREGDKMNFSTKVVNLTDKEMTGYAQFQLFDAATNEPVDGRFQNMVPNQYFTVAAGQSEAVSFPIEVPYQFNKALVWRIVAKAKPASQTDGGEFSDGEENAMPVLTNRMLVTETMSLPMNGAGTKNFSFDKLIKSGNSETLQHYALTVEYTSNPAWYAVQALPYLMEYPYDCAEQTWNRYYANSLATYIANSSPKIKEVFARWKITDTAALLSNLQKNQELKAVLLEETPWVLQAKSEAEQKKNLALLFDMVKMSEQLNASYEKLKQLQSSNGGFVWFKGGPDDRYMTQYIVTAIGHLQKLKSVATGQDAKLNQVLATAIPYLDKKIKEEYDQLVKNKTDLKKYTPGYSAIQYLYMRSFFPAYKIPAASQTAYNYFRSRLPLVWTQQNKYMQGMIALALHRTGDTKTPAAILKSLKETAVMDEEMGMYYKNTTRGWWWYEAPIERQALLIEAFQEISNDTKTVDALRTWLLKNKQTNRWESTKATAEACYALLLRGTQWLSNDPAVRIKLGNTTINSTDNKQEAGTGYFKKTIDGDRVMPSMGNIAVTVDGSKTESSATWGGIYWQYFEDLDKITTASTPLALVKKLFVEKNTDRGPVLQPVNDGDVLKTGDKIKVRIELRANRDMEYVHMKDMRASALEPVNVLSNYKWQGGLGYYETTKDASTNFFFSELRKGTYVFEYSLFVTHAGNFSNGVTTIQCMYAPEFSSHSEGIRITVE